MTTDTPDEKRFISSGSGERLKDKWGTGIGSTPYTGFVAIPEAMLRGQKDLGINPTEMVVLQNILMHWWHPDKMPFPSNEGIAKRMGVETRTVQRAMRSLETQGLIEREVTRYQDKESQSIISKRHINLTGLVAKVQDIARNLRTWNRNQKAELDARRVAAQAIEDRRNMNF